MKLYIVNKILNQLTPLSIKKEIQKVNNIEFLPKIQKWVTKYEKVGGSRNEFIWKLFLKVDQDLSYIQIDKKYHENLKEIRFLITMFTCLLDDVVDKTRNGKLLHELLKITSCKTSLNSNELNKKEKEYLKFTIKIWDNIQVLLKQSPMYKEYINLFKYDINQVLNGMNYDYVINEYSDIINKTEYWQYAPHTMEFVITTTVYIMYFPEFNINELGKIREIAWEAKKMLRIGNWVGTWEKELYSNDFTSGIFAYIIDEKILTYKELITVDKKIIIQKIKMSKTEDMLLNEWENSYKKIIKLGKGIKTINIKKFLISLEKFLFLEIINKNYKL